MPPVAGRIWSNRRKWAGNVLPALVSLPLLVGGLMLFQPEDPLRGFGLPLVVAFPVFGWICANFLALANNSVVRDELARLFSRRVEPAARDLWFVGIAEPGYAHALDPHADVAFLWIEDGELRLFAESREEVWQPSEIVSLRRRPNVHSWLGLGGWVAVETARGTVLLEPRRAATLMGNNLLRRRLLSEIEAFAGLGPRKLP